MKRWWTSRIPLLNAAGPTSINISIMVVPAMRYTEVSLTIAVCREDRHDGSKQSTKHKGICLIQ